MWPKRLFKMPKEWSKSSGQKGVVKKEWSKGVVKNEWSKTSGQKGARRVPIDTMQRCKIITANACISGVIYM